VYQDDLGQAKAKALAYADGIGGTRAGRARDHLQGGDRTDLFGSANGRACAVRATELVLKGYETLVKSRLPAESPITKCLHELKLIVDLLHEAGWPRCTSNLAHRQVGRPHPRPARGQQGTKKEMKQDPRRDPGRQLRARLDLLREQDRPQEVRPP